MTSLFSSGITSCNKKCYDHTCINTFAGMRTVVDDVHNNNVNFHMKKRILHEWPFHMKFIKLTEGSLNKVHIK